MAIYYFLSTIWAHNLLKLLNLSGTNNFICKTILLNKTTLAIILLKLIQLTAKCEQTLTNCHMNTAKKFCTWYHHINKCVR